MTSRSTRGSLFLWGLIPEAATAPQDPFQSRPFGPGGLPAPRYEAASGRYTPGPLATLANLGVDWSRTTHQNDHLKGTETMPRYEAYLGANKPETLAAGEGEADAKYGVVRQSYATGSTTWVGGFAHYGSAMGAVNNNTTHLGFGIMCLLRPEPEQPTTSQGYRFLRGIPVQVAQGA